MLFTLDSTSNLDKRTQNRQNSRPSRIVVLFKAQQLLAQRPERPSHPRPSASLCGYVAQLVRAQHS